MLKLLGTQVIRRGLTASDISLNLPEIYHKNPLEIADLLQGRFETETRSFYCVVQLNGDSSHVHSLFAQNGFQKARTKDFPLNEVGQEFKESISHQTAFRYETEAISHVAAATHAVQACRRVIDVFNLYQNRASIELNADILVVDDRRSTIVFRHTEQSLASQPSRSARKLTREALHCLRFDDLDSGLENSLEQHSLALSSSEQKASLVGIWTAFECLMGSDGRDSNVKRIIDWIAPIVALRQVEKLLAISQSAATSTLKPFANTQVNCLRALPRTISRRVICWMLSRDLNIMTLSYSYYEIHLIILCCAFEYTRFGKTFTNRPM